MTPDAVVAPHVTVFFWSGKHTVQKQSRSFWVFDIRTCSLKEKLTLNLQLFYLEPMILLVFIYQFSRVFYKIQSLKPEQLDLSQVAPFPRNSAEKNDSIDLTWKMHLSILGNGLASFQLSHFSHFYSWIFSTTKMHNMCFLKEHCSTKNKASYFHGIFPWHWRPEPQKFPCLFVQLEMNGNEL